MKLDFQKRLTTDIMSDVLKWPILSVTIPHTSYDNFFWLNRAEEPVASRAKRLYSQLEANTFLEPLRLQWHTQKWHTQYSNSFYFGRLSVASVESIATPHSRLSATPAYRRHFFQEFALINKQKAKHLPDTNHLRHHSNLGCSGSCDPYAVWGFTIFIRRMNPCNDLEQNGIFDCFGEYVGL
jgi:hypothetical protein